MAKDRTLKQKIGDFMAVYEVVRHEVTTPTMRKMVAQMEGVQNASELQGYIVLARVVSANDRVSAIVAAMLTQSGVSRPIVNADGEGDES